MIRFLLVLQRARKTSCSTSKYARFTMKHLMVIIIAVFIILLSEPCYAQITRCSYAFSKQYCFTITANMLKVSPVWSEDADNPPLPARKAIRLATKLKNELVKDTEKFKWKLESCSLEQAETSKWYWFITYFARYQGSSTGIPHHLQVIVLMDGTVIRPMVKAQR